MPAQHRAVVQADTVDRRPLTSQHSATNASRFPVASTSATFPRFSPAASPTRAFQPFQSAPTPMNEDPQSVVSNAYRSFRGSATESNEWRGHERSRSVSTELGASRGAKRPRQDSTQVGSWDEIVLKNGDRVADAIIDPRHPRSTSSAFIPNELGEKLHTIYVNNYPAHYDLQKLSDLLTLPGHPPPLAVHSKFDAPRQRREHPTKYAFAAFELESTKRAVLQALDGYNVEHSKHYMLKVKEPKVTLSGTLWHCNSFTVEFLDRYEAGQHSLAPAQSSNESGRHLPVPDYPGFELLVPHKLMVQFPQLHLNQLPSDLALITAPFLWNFIADRVDPASILAVKIGNLDQHGSLAAYVAMKTTEAAEHLMKSLAGFRFNGSARDLFIRQIPSFDNWRKWNWSEMSEAFVDEYGEEYRSGWTDTSRRSPAAAGANRVSRSLTLADRNLKAEPKEFVAVEPKVEDPASRDSSIEFEEIRPKLETV